MKGKQGRLLVDEMPDLTARGRAALWLPRWHFNAAHSELWRLWRRSAHFQTQYWCLQFCVLYINQYGTNVSPWVMKPCGVGGGGTIRAKLAPCTVRPSGCVMWSNQPFSSTWIICFSALTASSTTCNTQHSVYYCDLNCSSFFSCFFFFPWKFIIYSHRLVPVTCLCVCIFVSPGLGLVSSLL